MIESQVKPGVEVLPFAGQETRSGMKGLNNKGHDTAGEPKGGNKKCWWKEAAGLEGFLESNRRGSGWNEKSATPGRNGAF